MRAYVLKETTGGGEFRVYRASARYIDLLSSSYNGNYPPENVLECRHVELHSSEGSGDLAVLKCYRGGVIMRVNFQLFGAYMTI